MAIKYTDIADDLRAYVLGAADVIPDEYSDEEITACAKKAAFELLNFKRHLLADASGKPKGSSAVVNAMDGDKEAADLPEKYKGALMHGALMFLFTEDQQRSSFERGLFMQQAGLGR